MTASYESVTSLGVRSLIISLGLFLASACAGSSATEPPTPTPRPACRGETCIKDVYFEVVDSDTLLIQFDLVDDNSQVEFGAEPVFESKFTFALYLEDEAGGSTYLAGMEPSPDIWSCYAGNDIPWSGGSLAAVCSLSLPLSMLQIRIKEGDPVRIETIGFQPEFNRAALWLEPG